MLIDGFDSADQLLKTWQIAKMGYPVYKFEKVRDSIDLLEGGAYQALAQRYALVEFDLSEPYYLGIKPGSTKPVKGTPDAFYRNGNDELVAVECSHFPSNKNKAKQKIKSDISKCLEKEKEMSNGKLSKIVCFHTCSRFDLEDINEIKAIDPRVKLVGADEVAEGICKRHFFLADEYLGLKASNQVFLDEETFIMLKERDVYEASLKDTLEARDDELVAILTQLKNSQVVLISGKSGAGKTKLALEAARTFAHENNIDFYCLKASREYLGEELSLYFSHGKEVLFLVDDVNELADVDVLIKHALAHPNIHLLLTVRDYARDTVENKVKSVPDYSSIVISPVENDVIYKVVRSRMSLPDDRVVSNIVRMAKGNLRLAILAAENIKANNYESIDHKNLLDICYGYKLQALPIEMRCAAEIASILGPHLTKNNGDLTALEAIYGIAHDEYILSCAQLCEKELMDMRQDYLAVSFEEQNLRDYFLYNAIASTKRVSLEDLWELEAGLALFDRAMRILFGVFNDESLVIQASEAISNIWESVEEKNRLEFIEKYGLYLGAKSLIYLHDQIAKLPIKRGDFSRIDIESIKRRGLHDPLVRAVVAHLSGEYYMESIALLLDYLDRDSTNASDFLSVFSTKIIMSPDNKIVTCDDRLAILRQLASRRESGNKEGLDACLLCLTSAIWDDGFAGELATEAGVHVAHGNVSCQLEELVDLRKESFRIFTEATGAKAQDLLLNYTPGLGFGNCKELAKSTLLLIDGLIDIDEAWTLRDVINVSKLNQHATKRGIELVRIKEKLASTWPMRLVDFFLHSGVAWRQQDDSYLAKLATYADEATFDGIDELMSLLSSKDLAGSRHEWTIQSNIAELFKYFRKENLEMARYFCDAYISHGLSASAVAAELTAYLLEEYGYAEAKSIIIDAPFPDHGQWLFCLDEVALRDNKIDSSKEELMLCVKEYGERFCADELLGLNDLYPGFYEEYLSFLVSAGGKDGHDLDIAMLPSEANLERYRQLVKQDPTLASLLQQALLCEIERGEWVDLDKLGCMLVELDPSFITPLFFSVSSSNRSFDVMDDLASMIWKSKSSKVLICHIVKGVMQKDAEWKYSDWMHVGKILQHAGDKAGKSFISRLMLFIRSHAETNEFIDVACCLTSNQKLDLVAKMAQRNDEWETIRDILITSQEHMESWSGSYVPLIDARIKFAERAKSKLSDLGIRQYEFDFIALFDELKQAIRTTELEEFVSPFYHHDV